MSLLVRRLVMGGAEEKCGMDNPSACRTLSPERGTIDDRHADNQ